MIAPFQARIITASLSMSTEGMALCNAGVASTPEGGGQATTSIAIQSRTRQRQLL